MSTISEAGTAWSRKARLRLGNFKNAISRRLALRDRVKGIVTYIKLGS